MEISRGPSLDTDTHIYQTCSHSLSWEGRDNQVPGSRPGTAAPLVEHPTLPTWNLSAFSQPLS